MNKTSAIFGKSTLCLGLAGGLGLAGLASVVPGQVPTRENRSSGATAVGPMEEPTTQPTTRSAGANEDDEAEGVAERVGGSMGSRLGDRLGRGDRDRQRSREGDDREEERREPTEAEWEETVAFLGAHAPRRLAMYERFLEWAQSRTDESATQPDEQGRRSRDPESMIRYVRSRIFHRVQSLQHLADRDPELYTFALRQFELEDEIYGIMAEVRRAREAGDEEALAAAEARARDAMHRYAENTLAERESRIERLSQELAREQERLERDRQNIDQIISRLEKRFGDSDPPDSGRRRRGGDRDSDSDRSGDKDN